MKMLAKVILETEDATELELLGEGIRLATARGKTHRDQEMAEKLYAQTPPTETQLAHVESELILMRVERDGAFAARDQALAELDKTVAELAATQAAHDELHDMLKEQLAAAQVELEELRPKKRRKR